MNPRVWIAASFVFLLNLALNWRIVLPGITPYRGSIERGYAYMARLVADNPDYLSWNPLQYGGLPIHYVYLPLLPYFNALFLWASPALDATYVHRAVCAAAVFLAPAAVVLLVHNWTGRLAQAFWSAIVFTLFSPLYFLIDAIAGDRGFMPVPWRIQVLIKYGEGPHTVGVLLFLLGLYFVRRVATSHGFPSILAAAIALAATVLTNWVAGLALAFAVLILLLVHWGDESFSHRRVVLAGLLGYLLAAFWLTPSFVWQMANNWPKDAFGFEFQRAERLALLAWIAGLLIIRLALRKLPNHRYTCWLFLCAFGFGLPVSLFYRFGINTIPESRRYALEYELFLLLLIVDLFRLLLGSRIPWVRTASALLLLVAVFHQTPTLTKFIGHRYEPWQLLPTEESSEYRVAAALNNLRPAGRVFATGGLRFRLNSWFRIPQVSGVFETGLKTPLMADINYQVLTDLGFTPGREALESITLLRAVAVEYVVTHGRESEEFYRDFKNPRKFDGVLEKVWEHKDDHIYRISPARYAHIVSASEIPGAVVTGGNLGPWIPYVDAMLNPARPILQFRWNNARHASVTGQLPQGMHVAFAIPWDPNFRAYLNGTSIPLKANSTGLMVSAALPADGTALELRFEPSTEELACAALSLLTAIACLAGLFWKRKA